MKTKRKKLTLDADDAPELTEELAKKLRPGSEMLPPELYAALIARKPGQRGKQKKPTKKPVYLRLDPEVLDYLKASGAGWQSRINAFLKDAIRNQSL
jgi:uncharacterized protein (DUF4415 family)